MRALGVLPCTLGTQRRKLVSTVACASYAATAAAGCCWRHIDLTLSRSEHCALLVQPLALEVLVLALS